MTEEQGEQFLHELNELIHQAIRATGSMPELTKICQLANDASKSTATATKG